MSTSNDVLNTLLKLNHFITHISILQTIILTRKTFLCKLRNKKKLKGVSFILQ